MNPRAALRVPSVRADERWRDREGGAGWSTIAVAIFVGSLVLHVALLAFAMHGARAEAVAPQEIPVEIVQEPAAEAPKPQTPPERHAAPPPPTPTPLQAAKAPDPAPDQRADLERELAALKSEQASLKAEDTGGPLRDSIRAAALPSEASGGDADAVSYQSLVFSQLARAKEGIASKAVAGTVGIRFSLDEAGGLVDVNVVVSSGNASLDEEAVTIVRHAAPFPKPPAGAERVFSANVSSKVAAR